ncbi:MAG: hypothetical protein ABL949_01065 [Fimbriimonadaceae bacterium]
MNVLYEFTRPSTSYQEPSLLLGDPRGGAVIEFMAEASEGLGTEIVGIVLNGVQWHQHFIESSLHATYPERAYDQIIDLGETDMLAKIKKAVENYRSRPESAEKAKQLKHLRVGSDSDSFDFICVDFEVFGDL